jgi:hypothetical protein
MHKTTMLVLLLTCGTAQASDWVAVGKSIDGIEILIDVSSIRITGDIRRGWFKYVPARHTLKGEGSDARRWITFTQILTEYNCNSESSRATGQLERYEDGTSFSGRPPANWVPVAPDTVDEVGMRFICAWKPN